MLMKAKKSLGQNFLKSEPALNTIVETGEITEDDVVLEIGPGMGALTEKILETGAKVIAVEKDIDLIPVLKEKFSRFGDRFELIEGDVMEFDSKSLREYKLVANIPYYLTGGIIRKFLSDDNQPELAVLLVQKEVAKRIIDEKGSLLSISVKAYCDPKYIKTVPAGSFVPVPKVDSAIIKFSNISKDNFDVKEHEDLFFEILHAGFAHKRKKLVGNLKEVIEKYDLTKSDLVNILTNENIRAEELSLEEWISLTNTFLTKK